MYCTENKSDKYYLKELDENNKFNVIVELHGRDELVAFLANMSSGDNWTWREENRQWFNYLSKLWVLNESRTNRIFRQNLSGNDFYYIKEHKKEVIRISDDEYHESRTTTYYKCLYKYRFVDEYDIPLDIESYRNEVKDYYFKHFNKMNNIGIEDIVKKHKKFYPRTKRHTHWGGFHNFMGRTIRTQYGFDEYEDDTEELLYRPKPKWRSCYLGKNGGARHSAGWKDKKHRHQWEHNLINGNKKKHKKRSKHE